MASSKVTKHLSSAEYKIIKHTTTSDITVSANGYSSEAVVDARTGLCMGGIINDTGGTTASLIVYPTRYSYDVRLQFYNPTNAAITIPSGTELICWVIVP